MKNISLSLLLILSFEACRPQKNEFKSLKLYYNIPVFDINEGLGKEESIIFIFFYKDLVLYKLPYTLISKYKKGKACTSIQYDYFLCKKNTPIGKYFESLESKEINLPADSILNARALKRFSFTLGKHDSLINCKLNIEGYDQVCKFATINKPKETYADSTILYYSEKLNEFDFSFSESFEKKEGKKLTKIIFLHNAFFSERFKMNIPERKFVFAATPAREAVPIEIKQLLIRESGH